MTIKKSFRLGKAFKEISSNDKKMKSIGKLVTYGIKIFDRLFIQHESLCELLRTIREVLLGF